MPLEIFDYATILIELNKAVKMHNFYPDGHPNFESALEKCFLQLRKCLDEQNEIKWNIDQKGFYISRTPVPASPEIVAIAKKLFFRRIKEITFTTALTLREIKVFLSLFKLEPEDIQARGGVEAIFAENDIAGILLNEFKYEDIKRLKKELEEKKQGEKQEAAKEEKATAEPGEAEKAGEEEPPPPQEQTQDEDLAVLIERIKTERDFLRYNDLSVRIKEKADIILVEKKLDDIFQILLMFLDHSSPSSTLNEQIKTVAGERLKSLINDDMISYLAARVGKKDEPLRIAVQHMLLSAGLESVNPLLDAIIAAPEAMMRRHLYNTLVLFGTTIRPHVEDRLNSSEWFVVRQMVSLLGDLGDPQSIDALIAAYRNPDPRVKKEVLKSLVKLKSPRTTEFLVRTLDEEDDSLVCQAIISLGMLKDSACIDVLGKIAVKREAFSEPPESTKEAIKALGIIGDRKAVPYLSNILFRKVWFGKKANEEARFLAAQSLGLISGPEAHGALKEACENSAGDLYLACKRILEGRERNT